MSMLQQARFFTTVGVLEQLPMLGVPEIAFAGRSNAGKSSAINALCQQKRLAFASKTPGRTQHLNYFGIGAQTGDPDVPAAFLVDLPGYGYAKAGHTTQSYWSDALGAYIRQRDTLVALVLVMDARRPLLDLDCALLDWFAPTGKPVHALLTKADKLNRAEAARVLEESLRTLRGYGGANSAALLSSLKRSGVEEAQERVLELLGLKEAKKNPGARGMTPG